MFSSHFIVMFYCTSMCKYFICRNLLCRRLLLNREVNAVVRKCPGIYLVGLTWWGHTLSLKRLQEIIVIFITDALKEVLFHLDFALKLAFQIAASRSLVLFPCTGIADAFCLEQAVTPVKHEKSKSCVRLSKPTRDFRALIWNSHCQSMLLVMCAPCTLQTSWGTQLRTSLVCFQYWQFLQKEIGSSFGKGPPIGDLSSLPFISSSDNHFPSSLFIFKLFKIWMLKWQGAFPAFVSRLSYDW